ncbi:MAG: heparan-alpha-glucosaminide N-acetyltransferase [Nanoarchaeota archaeon]
MTTRFWEIDFARGLAITGMILFHFIWNLNYFGYTNFNLYSGLLGIFQKTIAITFLLLVGIGLTLSANGREHYEFWFLKRGLFIFGLGMLITAFTFLFFKEGLIFFGVLHLIGASIILAIPFAKHIYASIVTGLTIIAAGLYLQTLTFDFPYLLWLGFFYPTTTFDYYPILPWFGVILIGTAFGNLLYKNGKRIIELKYYNSIISKLGKYSLLIYFIHQPILFGLLMLLSYIK